MTEDLFLSRYAECIFWMSRYLERAESIASLLDVTYSFSTDSRDEQNWNSLLSLYCDGQAFSERYTAITADNVIHFYVTDSSHGNSIASCIHAARFNARQLRSVISSEMWMQLNTLYNNICKTAQGAIKPQDLWHVLSGIRRECQMLTGIAEGTTYRDQGWFFYLAGKHLERADQSTRLLDIKYHLLLPSVDDVGSTIDDSQWFALLRAAGGYHAFRREYPYVVSPSTVAGFLLLDRRFPRSVSASTKTLGWALKKLFWQCGLVEAKTIIDMNEELILQMKNDTIRTVIRQGLHEYLDNIQLRLTEISGQIARGFFCG